MKRTILCDLDDTLADARWRLPFWGDWDKFYGESPKDKPIEPMCDLVRFLASSFTMHILTAREERYRDLTKDWLAKNGIWYSKLIMRPNDTDKISSPVLKPHLAHIHLGANWRDKVCLVIDDREDVLAAFRAEGVMTLQATMPGEKPALTALEKI